MSEQENENKGGDDYIERVRRRAYAIWMDQGQVHGRDEEHWHEAEREIAAEAGAPSTSTAAEPKPAEPTAAEPTAGEPEKKTAETANPLAPARKAPSR